MGGPQPRPDVVAGPVAGLICFPVGAVDGGGPVRGAGRRRAGVILRPGAYPSVRARARRLGAAVGRIGGAAGTRRARLVRGRRRRGRLGRPAPAHDDETARQGGV